MTPQSGKRLNTEGNVDKISGMTLTPAYGRDYKSKKEIVADLNAGKDFTANHYTGQGGYCSVSDLADGSHTFRFKKNASVTLIKVKDGKALEK
jgi:hypothetical protein